MLSTMAPVSAAGMMVRIAFSTSPKRAAVSSMRMPTGARTCIKIWPPSTCGKKLRPRKGASRKEISTNPRKPGMNTPRWRMAKREEIVISRAQPHEARLEPALKADQRVAGRRLAAVVVRHVHPQQILRHRRHERSRQQEREDHGEHDALGHGDEQEPRHTLQEEHRDEHDADAKEGHEGRHDDLGRAVHDRLLDTLTLLEVIVDALDRHRRLVDQDTDREREAAQGHDIERLAERPQRTDGAQDRQWNGGGHDQGRAPAAQEQQDHETGKRRRDHAFPDHALDGCAHEQGLIADRLDFELVRQGGLDDAQHLLDAADDVERRRRAVLEDTQQNRAIAVDVDDVGLHGAAAMHVRHIVHVHHGAAHALDRKIREIRNLRWRIVEVDRVFVVADFLGAGRSQNILCGKRIGDILSCKPKRLHGARIEVVHHLRRLAAEGKRNAGALHRDQPCAHEIEAEIRQILLRESVARERELDDGHGGGAVVQDQRRRLAGRQLLEERLRDRRHLRIGGGDVGPGVKEDFHDAERRVRVRLDVLDVVHRGGERALERRDDPSRHLVGRQSGVLKGDADDGNIDAWKDIDRHAQRRERAEDEYQKGGNDERVGAGERDPDYGEHSRQSSGAANRDHFGVVSIEMRGGWADISAPPGAPTMATWRTRWTSSSTKRTR